MKEIIVQVAAYSADYPKAPIYVADLIRCRECKYSGVRNDADVECKRHKLIMRLNDFCSYGEREGE